MSPGEQALAAAMGDEEECASPASWAWRPRSARWRLGLAFLATFARPRSSTATSGGDVLDYGVFAGAFPEDEIRLVRALRGPAQWRSTR